MTAPTPLRNMLLAADPQQPPQRDLLSSGRDSHLESARIKLSLDNLRFELVELKQKVNESVKTAEVARDGMKEVEQRWDDKIKESETRMLHEVQKLLEERLHPIQQQIQSSSALLGTVQTSVISLSTKIAETDSKATAQTTLHHETTLGTIKDGAKELATTFTQQLVQVKEEHRLELEKYQRNCDQLLEESQKSTRSVLEKLDGLATATAKETDDSHQRTKKVVAEVDEKHKTLQTRLSSLAASLEPLSTLLPNLTKLVNLGLAPPSPSHPRSNGLTPNPTSNRSVSNSPASQPIGTNHSPIRHTPKKSSSLPLPLPSSSPDPSQPKKFSQTTFRAARGLAPVSSVGIPRTHSRSSAHHHQHHHSSSHNRNVPAHTNIESASTTSASAFAFSPPRPPPPGSHSSSTSHDKSRKKKRRLFDSSKHEREAEEEQDRQEQADDEASFGSQVGGEKKRRKRVIEQDEEDEEDEGVVNGGDLGGGTRDGEEVQREE